MMTPEELKQLIIDQMAALEAKLEEMVKTSVADQLPDHSERFTTIEEQLGNLQDTLKSLDKPSDGPPGAVDGDTGDPYCGYGEAGMGDLAGDVIRRAATNGADVSAKLGRLIAITEERRKQERAAGTGFEAGDAEFGGYLLPEGFRSDIWMRALEISNIMSKVFVIPVSTLSIKLPAMGGYDRSGGTVFGGITFYDEPENDQLQDVRPKFEQIGFTLGMQGAMTHVSDQMMRFSPITMGAFIQQRFAEALAWRIEYLLINGTGAGQPEGVLNCNCKVEQAKETGQPATTVVYENIINMKAHIWLPNNAEWYYNHEVIPQLAKMEFTIGTAGERIRKEDALQYPDFMNEHCQALGTAGDIILPDWSQYGVALPQGQAQRPVFDTSIHFKFDYAQTSFRMLWYMAGHSMWRTYDTPRHGTNYLTPVVTLAVRS